MRVWPGQPFPLGAHWDGEGVNVALFSEHATGVEFCAFDGGREVERVPLRERTDCVWHAYLPDVRPGQRYGFRVDGPYEPSAGHRFNRHKLIVDPYARALDGPGAWSDALFGYRIGDPAADLSFDDTDSAADVPKSIVVESEFSWGADRPPRVPWSRTVIYECHVRGLTMRHPQVPENLRGTYLGLATDPVIEHLLALGVTAVELMPVHQCLPERAVVDRGLTNYWGYNTLGFFAPDGRYATAADGRQVAEFKSMVKTLHRAGIEVILDVVYNHTCEADHLGPTVCLRGIDNASYYRLSPEDRRYYVDFTGCGNSVDTSHPRAIQLVMDSLRYWVREMHVDGFRFDLAATLARDAAGSGGRSPFFDVILQDPILTGCKLIAEPWDLGHDGYQAGRFPAGWGEWNDKYRDAARRYWRGDPGLVPELANRLAGSSDLHEAGGKPPHASINFVTCHDGFSLEDLVSYEHKHNEANGEDNRDGSDTNWSRNWGVEGPTGNESILALRERVKRSLLATLALSQGVPMLRAGDELGATQNGNNNAYCQDNELSWLDWDLGSRERELLDFTRRLLAIRLANPVLRRRSFFRGPPEDDRGEPDIVWLRADGEEFTDAEWHDPHGHVLGMMLPGEAADAIDDRGYAIVGDTLLVLLNGGQQARAFRLPEFGQPGGWHLLLDTARPKRHARPRTTARLAAHSLMLLRHGEP